MTIRLKFFESETSRPLTHSFRYFTLLKLHKIINKKKKNVVKLKNVININAIETTF